ncbi:protein phosphatase 1 regulatory subunit 37 [Parasteatoda tepidariorum]|uniref:protein phosphatase 1 regulatory subunit 37 n=1 Tax=Parasteatoda tepidariorum TaxID=114398 RepID=UPI00077FBFF9|nr:protein phosphatase 1 regulatory subunit 37 [Parasteatoda tepidariorum]
MNSNTSVSAPSTPTEQIKQIHSNVSAKKKAKCSNRVHFPADEILVTCYLEPPDPWSKVYANTLNTLISAYIAASDKQGIKPLPCVLDQLQEFESNSNQLEENPRSFDLSILGEKLSLKHCEALEEILRRLQFNLVDLEGCYLDDEGAAAFFDMIEYYDSAEQLNISFTKQIDCRGWQACSRMLKKTPSLIHLNARSTGLNEQVLLIIGRALRLGSNLVTLHLENCGIFGRCLVILVAALKMNTTLRELFLAENKISSADGFQLGNLLRTNTHLELIDLSNNKLGDEGLTHVMDSLGQQSNTSGRGLSTLILWNNEITIKSMACISRALTAARALRRLNLGSNEITSAGILDLKQSFICNRTIEILELENAAITSDGACALAEYISQNQFIQKLDIRGNDIRLDGLEALTKVVSKNSNIISLKIDPTSKDLSEPLVERQEKIQEIIKCCQRNKEAKDSLPPQDAQLTTLFNGIFSHVLPSPQPGDSPSQNFKPDMERNDNTRNSFRGRFRVSVVELNQENISKSSPGVDRSFSLDSTHYTIKNEGKVETGDPIVNKSVKTVNLVSDRIKWLEDLKLSGIEYNDLYSSFSPKIEKIDGDSEVFMSAAEMRDRFQPRDSLCLELHDGLGTSTEPEQKVRRSSSPTISSTPSVSRKTRSIKCCKELEGLDLRSTVPLSPTRLHESFDFQEPQVKDVPLNDQMNIKSSHAVYMVH